MSQNTSSAVMQQRREPHDSLDDFPTPPWATRALCEYVLAPRFGKLSQWRVWEPACNRGYMARPLSEYFGSVVATDIHAYGWPGQTALCDFLFPGVEEKCDWIVTNPPFRLAEQFIYKARRIASVGCAVLVRSAFLEGVGRFENLFRLNPPTVIAQFSERVPMVKGRVDSAVSTATAYCWLVWVRREQDHPFYWIPPCRKQLERAEDYA